MQRRADDGARGPDSPSADEILVRRASADPGAFAELYRRYVDAVYWYCARRVGDPWAADDATSQVFVQALTALPRFVVSDGTFRSWLFRIAHNVTIDAARRRRPQVPLDEEEARLVDSAPTPEEALLAAEAEQELRQALVQLTEDQQAVVLLRLAGLTGAEISGSLGRGRSWVDTTHFRAIARLRVLLIDDVALEETSNGVR